MNSASRCSLLNVWWPLWGVRKWSLSDDAAIILVASLLELTHTHIHAAHNTHSWDNQDTVNIGIVRTEGSSLWCEYSTEGCDFNDMYFVAVGYDGKLTWEVTDGTYVWVAEGWAAGGEVDVKYSVGVAFSWPVPSERAK